MRTRAQLLFLDKYHFTVYTFTVYQGFILVQIATSSSRIKSELTASILTSICPDSSSHVVDTIIDVVSVPNESEVLWTFCCVNRSQSKILWIFECIACIRPRELVIVFCFFWCCCSLSLRRSSQAIKNRTFGRYICTAALQVHHHHYYYRLTVADESPPKHIHSTIIVFQFPVDIAWIDKKISQRVYQSWRVRRRRKKCANKHRKCEIKNLLRPATRHWPEQTWKSS